ncbi:MAG: PDZ domain-containing protein [Verrucomicrobia bacterium]|nr:PDZ domain-containing protein [Verrucomicrobiota bacterium]
MQALGIEVRDLSVPERMQGFRGVVVTRLAANGLAAKLIRAGDLIVAVNSTRIGGVNEFFLHLAASASVQDTQIQLIREGQALRVTVPALPRME